MSPSARVAFRSCRFDLAKAFSLLCTFVLLLLPLTAHAGSYVWTTRDAQGNITAQSPVYSGGTSYGQGYMGPGTHDFGPTNGGWGGGGGGVAAATAGGTITATFTWQPDPTKTMATDPPPAQVLVVETSSASATGLNSPAYPVASASCNDGIGPSGVMTTNYYPTETNPSYSVTTGSCQDVRRKLMKGSTSLTFTCTLQAKANGNQAACSASAYYSVLVQADNRSVAISCPAIDNPASYYKGATSRNGSARLIHIRDASTGAMSVDSVATYTNADWAYGGAWIATATLFANTYLFTDPSYAWSSDFNPSQMVGASLTQQSVNGSWLFGPTGKFPVTKTVRVDVQDGPSVLYPVSASNTYTIIWHQPFEQWADCQPAVAEEIDTIAPSSVPTGIPGGQVAYADQVYHCDFEFGPNQMADGIVSAQKILPVTQPFFGPIWQSLIGAAGQPFDKALLGVSTSHDVVNNSDAFTEATYLTTIGRSPLVQRDNLGKIETHEKYVMTSGLLSAHYKKRFLQGDAYDVHGYAGPSPTKTARQIFKVQATGTYVLIQSL